MNVQDLMKALTLQTVKGYPSSHYGYMPWTKRKRGGTQLESVSNGLLDQC